MKQITYNKCVLEAYYNSIKEQCIKEQCIKEQCKKEIINLLKNNLTPKTLIG